MIATGWGDLRERSWRLRCSLLLKARLQNWHLYFFSGWPVLRAAGAALAAMAAGMTGEWWAAAAGRLSIPYTGR
jgi:hypothetical protein